MSRNVLEVVVRAHRNGRVIGILLVFLVMLLLILSNFLLRR